MVWDCSYLALVGSDIWILLKGKLTFGLRGYGVFTVQEVD